MPQPDNEAEAAFIEAYGRSFAAYHHAWSEFFVGHMGDLRRGLGDLDEALLLAAIGLGAVAGKRRAAERRRDRGALRLHAAPAPPVPTNALRLAEITGIPRETVRRKLARFRDRGWVEQAADGSWRIAVGADGRVPLSHAMAGAHAEFLRRLAQLMAGFAAIEAEAKRLDSAVEGRAE